MERHGKYGGHPKVTRMITLKREEAMPSNRTDMNGGGGGWGVESVLSTLDLYSGQSEAQNFGWIHK